MEGKKDSKGQRETAGMVKDTALLISENRPLFEASLLIARSEKVVTAAYLLTEHIEPLEPIRGRMRDLSLELLKDINMAGRAMFAAGMTERLSSLTLVLGELSALIDVAVLSRMISEGNGALLKRELSGLREMLGQISGAISERMAFPDDLFNLPEMPELKTIPGKLPPRGGAPTPGIGEIHKGQKERNVLYRTSPHEGKSEDNGDAHANRRELILKLVRKEKLLSIKDIYGFFTGVSEKTIQRELTRMVSEGVLARKGDKRWSKYALSGE